MRVGLGGGEGWNVGWGGRGVVKGDKVGWGWIDNFWVEVLGDGGDRRGDGFGFGFGWCVAPVFSVFMCRDLCV